MNVSTLRMLDRLYRDLDRAIADRNWTAVGAVAHRLKVGIDCAVEARTRLQESRSLNERADAVMLGKQADLWRREPAQ